VSIYGHGFACLQIGIHDCSTGSQKSDTLVFSRNLLSATAQAGTTTSVKGTIQVAPDINITKFTHVGTRERNEIGSRLHMGPELDL
jgi:hypothetical protein